jgi:hypothetical protein
LGGIHSTKENNRQRGTKPCERFIAEIKKILENEETFLNVLKIIEDYISSIRGQQIKEVLKNVSAKKYNSVKSNIRRIINDFIEDKEIVIDTISNIQWIL